MTDSIQPATHHRLHPPYHEERTTRGLETYQIREKDYEGNFVLEYIPTEFDTLDNGATKRIVKKPKIKDNRGTIAEYEIHKENDTLGNLLRLQLISCEEEVLFAAYYRPHPLEEYIVLKMETDPHSDPDRVLDRATHECISAFGALQRQFYQQTKLMYTRE